MIWDGGGRAATLVCVVAGVVWYDEDGELAGGAGAGVLAGGAEEGAGVLAGGGAAGEVFCAAAADEAEGKGTAVPVAPEPGPRDEMYASIKRLGCAPSTQSYIAVYSGGEYVPSNI